jgi:hypothetical protein
MLPLLLALPAASAQESTETPGLQPAITLVLPFGVPQYASHRPGLATIFASTQVVGIGLGAWGLERQLHFDELEEYEKVLRYRMMSWSAVSIAALSWFTSSLEGSRHYQIQKVELAQVWAWESQRVAMVQSGALTMPQLEPAL